MFKWTEHPSLHPRHKTYMITSPLYKALMGPVQLANPKFCWARIGHLAAWARSSGIWNNSKLIIYGDCPCQSQSDQITLITAICKIIHFQPVIFSFWYLIWHVLTNLTWVSLNGPMAFWLISNNFTLYFNCTPQQWTLPPKAPQISQNRALHFKSSIKATSLFPSIPLWWHSKDLLIMQVFREANKHIRMHLSSVIAKVGFN